MSKIAVIAGTYEQARNWAQQNSLGVSDWWDISDPDRLRGLRPSKIVFVGTYVQRRDFEQLAHQVNRLESMGSKVERT